MKGILQDFGGQQTIFLYPSEEDREDTWNSLTKIGREKYGWKKVEVEIKDNGEEG